MVIVLNIAYRLLISFTLIFIFTSCTSQNTKNEVVIYVSVDQVFSSKILQQFEKDTGIKVKAVYDTEASKAVGLEKRLLAEKSNPRADIFWNSEFLRTARLAKAGVLEDLNPSVLEYSMSMGVRSRVLIINTDLVNVNELPSSLADLTDSKWKGKVAICNPYFGTASTHFAALYYKWGKEKFIKFLEALKENKTALLAGNSVVKDAVGNGKYSFGLVDTDDALVGIEEGLPLKMIYYDQDDIGMFSIHQTVSFIKGAKHPKNAKILLDYLLTPKIEQDLIDMHAVQFPMLRKEEIDSLPKMWSVSGLDIVEALKPSIKLMRTHLE